MYGLDDMEQQQGSPTQAEVYSDKMRTPGSVTVNYRHSGTLRHTSSRWCVAGSIISPSLFLSIGILCAYLDVVHNCRLVAGLPDLCS